jgi:hypothetical protein
LIQKLTMAPGMWSPKKQFPKNHSNCTLWEDFTLPVQEDSWNGYQV